MRSAAGRMWRRRRGRAVQANWKLPFRQMPAWSPIQLQPWPAKQCSRNGGFLATQPGSKPPFPILSSALLPVHACTSTPTTSRLFIGHKDRLSWRAMHVQACSGVCVCGKQVQMIDCPDSIACKFK